MSTKLHIVTVGKDKQKEKDAVGSVAKELEKQYTLIHVAHCENINTIKHVLTSLITPPNLLIVSSGTFDEEQEEIREIANRVFPEMKLVMVPNDLDAKDGGEVKDRGLVEYLREQVESRF